MFWIDSCINDLYLTSSSWASLYKDLSFPLKYLPTNIKKGPIKTATNAIDGAQFISV